MTPSIPNARQTLSWLQQLFASHHLQPKKKLGQNFLIDLNLLDVVVRSAELSQNDLVLEVGTGTGSLTSRLSEAAKAVLSVEIDRDFYALAKQILASRPNVTLLNADILKNKNHLNEGVLTGLRELKEQTGCQSLKLVANLPYVVATPVLSNLLLCDLPFERMIVMVQWEIAERLLAEPGTRDYGALAVLVQSLADVRPLRGRVPPSVFWPRPQVASAIIGIWPSPVKRALVGDVLRLRHFLRDLYSHRRKNLRGALIAFPDRSWSKEEVDTRLAQLGFDGTMRAETLDVPQHLKLCEAFGK